MMKFFREEKGSISILTILLVIVMASFGALTVGLSYTSSILAKKNIEWIETYYMLEGEGEKQLAILDQVIAKGLDDCEEKLVTTDIDQFIDCLTKSLNDQSQGWQAFPYEEYIDVKFTVSSGGDAGDINLSVVARIEASDFILTQDGNSIANDFTGSGSYFRVTQWVEYQVDTQSDGLDDFDGTVKTK